MRSISHPRSITAPRSSWCNDIWRGWPVVTNVVLCSGNHDLDGRNAEGEKISRWVGDAGELGIHHDGEDLTIGDTLFTICPWWDGPLVKQRIDNQLRAAAARRPARWIWVHHAPPANSPVSWGGKRFFGDVELAQWIARYQPAMVFSGHVHQSPFIPDGSWFDRLGATWVFNTGRLPGRPPTHIVLDLDAAARSGWRPARRKHRPRRTVAAAGSMVTDPPAGLHPWIGLPIRSGRDP